MGLLLGGSVLTVFELIDLIVFRIVNTLFAAKQKPTADGAGAGESPARVQASPRSPVSPVATTINTPQPRIRRIVKYQPPPTPPTPALGGRPAVVVQSTTTTTPSGTSRIDPGYRPPCLVTLRIPATGTVVAENFRGPGLWKVSTVERQCATTQGQLALRNLNKVCTRKTYQYNNDLQQSTHRKTTSVAVVKLWGNAGERRSPSVFGRGTPFP